MEMETLHSRDQIETAEPGHSTESQFYKDAQVWKDIEAETGFASYVDYLESHPRHFRKLLEDFRKLPVDEAQPRLAIYDLSKQENLPIGPNLRRICSSGTELIKALREPPDDVCVQLVVWNFIYEMLNQEMADALTRGLRLDPEFFEHLRIQGRKDKKHEPPKHEHVRASELKSVSVNGGGAAISQNFLLGAATTVPVVLVAGNSILEEMLVLAQESYAIPLLRQDWVNILDLYWTSTVKRFIVTARCATPSKALLLLAAISPLLYAETCRIGKALKLTKKQYCPIVRDRSRGSSVSAKQIQHLEEERLSLRRTVEDAEDEVVRIFEYLDYEVDVDWSTVSSYVSIKADWRSLSDKARRLEAEIRDFMQLQVGSLALEESRKSIDLSNSQIREAKSGKFGGLYYAHHH